ncbi:hypothetical protein E2562_038019 [Oryza meyeriana var. granulata]|uniref:Uncharacterized protein n=1 Tax=Oryza meyeriana var. granulata TaxID=110450 RepID=A0A6G1ECT5_9ORYZ|nr:hypothetical protein E2562_038019 [Oryza meyeriana var. granulata]
MTTSESPGRPAGKGMDVAALAGAATMQTRQILVALLQRESSAAMGIPVSGEPRRAAPKGKDGDLCLQCTLTW